MGVNFDEMFPNLDGSLEQQLKLFNFIRRQYGARELQLNPKLQVAAQRHADWMAEKKIETHAGPPGWERAQERFDKANYKWCTVGELICCSNKPFSNVFAQWLATPKTGSCIQNQEFVHVGIAYKGEEGAPEKKYWCVALGYGDPG